ncbi:MAG: DNA mismatch repair endonuclease MutL [Myxococcales bacterium]|nr:DNA mismatch repair endonuclease MutL [Myxococcales bacterium]
MGKVQLLADDLINKIAAGEVVERPASVVKELVENSLDANAGRIDVELERGGKHLIRIVDDGFGMSEEDAVMSLQRHATSKLRNQDDLFRIMTMGFRGEAIPSIASVSRFVMETHNEEHENGVRVEVEGGKGPVVSPVGRPVGTTIEVHDLFFNVPARRKFLKADSTEVSHIAETMTRLALANPEVRFKLTHNRRVQLQCPATSDLRERIGSLLGRQIGEAMYPFEMSEGWLKLRGYFSRPDITSQNTKGIYFFVNGRFIRHRSFAHACQEAYRGSMEKGRYPYIVLFLEIDPAEVDVNVHPQKIEVRFHRESDIYNRLYSSLRNAIARTPWVEKGKGRLERAAIAQQEKSSETNEEASHVSDVSEPTQAPMVQEHDTDASSPSVAPTAVPTPSTAPASAKAPMQAAPSVAKPRPSESMPTSSSGASLAMQETPAAPRNFDEFRARFLKAAQEQKLAIEEPIEETRFAPLPSAQKGLPFLPGWDPPKEKGPQDEGPNTPSPAPAPKEAPPKGIPVQHEPERLGFFSSLRYIGQFVQMYLLFEYQDRLILLDQHAAHERVTYQRLLDGFQQERIPQQPYLVAPHLELGIVAAQQAEQFQDTLTKLGIHLEPFGGQTFVLRAVPVFLKKADPLELITDLLDEIAKGYKTASIDQRRDELLMRMACHGSVRGSHKLSAEEVRSLLHQLDEIEFKGNCPHGRPIFFEMTRAELEKRFHRT